jgi:hypothetical protein
LVVSTVSLVRLNTKVFAGYCAITALSCEEPRRRLILAVPPSVRLDLLPLFDDPIRDVRLAAARVLATLPAQNLDDEGRRRPGNPTIGVFNVC